MTIRRLSLGTAQFGTAYGVANKRGLPGIATVDAVLGLALEAGIQSLDTAASYGLSEERIGSFIRRRGCENAFEVCTKMPRIRDDASESELTGIVDSAVETSLRKLSVPYLDEYMLHDSTDLRRHGRAVVDALLEQRELGRVQKIGISAYDSQDLILLKDFPELDVVQHPLSVLDQRLLAGDGLSELHASGVSVHARSLFLQGLLSMSPGSLPPRVSHARDVLQRLYELLRDWNLTPVEASLQFVCRQSVQKIIIGVEDSDQLRGNLDAVAQHIPAELSELSELLSEAFRDVSRKVIDPRMW